MKPKTRVRTVWAYTDNSREKVLTTLAAQRDKEAEGKLPHKDTSLEESRKQWTRENSPPTQAEKEKAFLSLVGFFPPLRIQNLRPAHSFEEIMQFSLCW